MFPCVCITQGRSAKDKGKAQKKVRALAAFYTGIRGGPPKRGTGWGVVRFAIPGWRVPPIACVQKEAKQKAQQEKAGKREEKLRKKELAGTPRGPCPPIPPPPCKRDRCCVHAAVLVRMACRTVVHFVCACMAEDGEEDIEKILASLMVKEAEKTTVLQREGVDPPVRANCSIVRVGDEMILFGGACVRRPVYSVRIGVCVTGVHGGGGGEGGRGGGWASIPQLPPQLACRVGGVAGVCSRRV
jgi:hypothetical protein